jgi:hypothetical protein
MKKSLFLTAIIAAGLFAGVTAARYFDLIGFIKRLHGM